MFGLAFLRKNDKGVLAVLAHYTIGLGIILWSLINIAYPKFTDLSLKDCITFSISILSLIVGYVLLIVHKFIKDKKKEIKVYYTAAFLSIFGVLVFVYFTRDFLYLFLS